MVRRIERARRIYARKWLLKYKWLGDIFVRIEGFVNCSVERVAACRVFIDFDDESEPCDMVACSSATLTRATLCVTSPGGAL